MNALLLALLPSPASAFCGTFVSSYEEGLANAASEVVVVRQGNRTTLTVANDVIGDTRDFAMVVPVPEVLAEDQVHVVDPAVFGRLRAYSDPREVSYTCEDFAREELALDTGAESDTADTADTVEVEAQYIVGEYQVVILSAADSGGLVEWLQSNGYAVPDASAALLAEYIESGAYFFAAQVREDAAIASGQTLSPLQFSYATDLFGLPVRIGTLNSPGEQDLRVYAITDYEAGEVGVANYDRVAVDHDCMVRPSGDETIGAYYDRRLDDAFGNVAGAEWLVEYSWGNGNCDPCTGVLPTASDLYTLGYTPDTHYGDYYWLTRLRMRYAPGDVGQDLVLYESRTHETTQMRFIQYDPRFEDRFPVCDEGWIEGGGSCEDGPALLDGPTDTAGNAEGGCGCAAPVTPTAALALLALPLAAALRRRR